MVHGVGIKVEGERDVKISLSCQLVAVSCFISNNIITITIEYLGVDVQIQAVSNITVGINDYQY